MFFLHVGLCISHMPGGHRSQKRDSDLLELELHLARSCHVGSGTQKGPPEEQVSAPKCCTPLHPGLGWFLRVYMHRHGHWNVFLTKQNSLSIRPSNLFLGMDPINWTDFCVQNVYSSQSIMKSDKWHSWCHSTDKWLTGTSIGIKKICTNKPWTQTEEP